MPGDETLGVTGLMSLMSLEGRVNLTGGAFLRMQLGAACRFESGQPLIPDAESWVRWPRIRRDRGCSRALGYSPKSRSVSESLLSGQVSAGMPHDSVLFGIKSVVDEHKSICALQLRLDTA